VKIRWEGEGTSDPFPRSLPRRTDRHQSIEVVGQNPESDPDVRTRAASQTTVPPLILATAQADRRFLAAPPPLLTAEPSLALMRHPRDPESSFIGQADPLDASIAQERFVVFGPKAAIGGD